MAATHIAVIRTQMKQQCMTQHDLARRLGLSDAYVSDILRQRRRISADVAIKLEMVLGVDAGFLLYQQADCDLEMARESER